MKRLFDMFISLFFLVLVSPLLILLYVVIYLNLGSPVLFVQTRPGKNGQPFAMVKFRTMTDKRDSSGDLLADEDRITRFGKFLRSSSLDELPEFWNVLTGDMSLIGPRPLLMEYLGLYSTRQARRHDVRPGITGWAQVNGRNAISWDKKFELDIWYIDNCSFIVDLKILFLTVKKVLFRNDINEDGEVSMSKFVGNNNE